ERVPVSKSVAVAVPNGKATAPGFTKMLVARPGFTIADAAITNSNLAGVKDLKVQVAPDRRSASVSGEWAGDPKAVTKAVGGSDVIIPVALTEERSTPVPAAVTVVAGTFVGLSAFGAATLPLPSAPPGLAGSTREMTLEIRQLGPGGKPTNLKTIPLVPHPPGQPLWGEVLPVNGVGRRFAAVQEGDTLKVIYGGQEQTPHQ
ncbi:MAG TPA: hypothetical protein VKE74_06105, partial [Gemmataceae bacterium]|nr:hypothetical protein [Gemmataceae bacterium]